eukprot:scaffold17409_cov66-Skeletonema_marinoi.AAC.1
MAKKRLAKLARRNQECPCRSLLGTDSFHAEVHGPSRTSDLLVTRCIDTPICTQDVACSFTFARLERLLAA